MPLIRTPQGLQWLEPSDVPSDVPVQAVAAKASTLAGTTKRLSSHSKELLPWIIAASHLLSWAGVKYLTSDRLQQQQQDDHIAIADMRAQQVSLDKAIAALSAKIDLFLSMNRGH